jgi:hypothetical protein
MASRSRPQPSRLPPLKIDDGDDHLRRVRRICMALPESTEKISHEQPPQRGPHRRAVARAIGDDELAEHIREAWRLIAPKAVK